MSFLQRGNESDEDDGLSRSYSAVPDAIPAARREIADFAAAAGMIGERLDAVKLAASEALANGVVHAYRENLGCIHVTAAVASDELWILISDDGEGMHARTDSPGLGVGLALIAQVSDGMEIVSRGGGGTEVRMRF